MKTIIRSLALTCALLAMASVAIAQMRPAKMIPHMAKTSFTLNVSAQKVWNKLINIKEFEDYSNGMVKSSKNDGYGLNAKRYYTMSNGEKREEELSVFAPDVKKIVYKSVKAKLPIKFCYVHYQVVAKGKNKSKVILTAYAKPDVSKNKKKLQKLLGTEFKNIELGMKKYFK